MGGTDPLHRDQAGRSLRKHVLRRAGLVQGALGQNACCRNEVWVCSVLSPLCRLKFENPYVRLSRLSWGHGLKLLERKMTEKSLREQFSYSTRFTELEMEKFNQL